MTNSSTDKTRVLLVCANPRGTDPLRTAEEDRTLRESIRLSPKRDNFEVETLSAATIDDLRRALLRNNFDVVHFSGHGTRAGLIFEDALGSLKVPASAALAELLKRRKVRVALLNACYSLSVGKIAAIGTDFTIASTGPISDPGAIEFTRGFYDALGAGHDVPDAFEEGMSSANLKGYHLDAILLRQGEEYAPPSQPLQTTVAQSVPARSVPNLLGIAIDTSGSMKESIQNRDGENLTRFGSVKSALTDIGAQVRDKLSSTDDDNFRVFIYAFGLRIGSGVADMASLWAAARRINLKKEIETRKRRYEADVTAGASGYSGIASLLRSGGFGGIVDSVVKAGTNTVRQKIVGEIAEIVLAEADRIGDVTLNAQDLAGFFDGTASFDENLAEHVLFGSTPMADAMRKVWDRFQRSDNNGIQQRSLIIISDGAPTDGDPREVVSKLRDAGVAVAGCFVTSEDLGEPRTLYGSPANSWSEGARLMWDLSSSIDESGHLARYLLANGWSVQPNARLFVQANHSDVLREFARIVGTHFTNQARFFLPRGM